MVSSTLDGDTADDVERILYVQCDDRAVADSRLLLLDRCLGHFGYSLKSVHRRSTFTEAKLVIRESKVIRFLGIDRQVQQNDPLQQFPVVSGR